MFLSCLLICFVSCEKEIILPEDTFMNRSDNNSLYINNDSTTNIGVGVAVDPWQEINTKYAL